MTNERLDRRIRELARELRRPPATPREEIWVRIEGALGPDLAGRREAGGPGRGVRPARRTTAWPTAVATPAGSGWSGWSIAAAAALVLALGVGRLTAPGGPPAPGAVAGPADAARADAGSVAGPSAQDEAVYAATVRHLERTEPLLSMVRADAGPGRVDPALRPWARGLLLETRLLMDAPDVGDPALGALLEDVELFLAQVTVMAGDGAGDGERGLEDLRLIADGLEQKDVLTRIRTVLATSGSVIL